MRSHTTLAGWRARKEAVDMYSRVTDRSAAGTKKPKYTCINIYMDGDRLHISKRADVQLTKFRALDTRTQDAGLNQLRKLAG